MSPSPSTTTAAGSLFIVTAELLFEHTVLETKLLLFAEGDGVFIVSSELDEIMGLSDRILVMFKGRIVAEFDAAGGPVDRAAVGLAMAGAAA